MMQPAIRVTNLSKRYQIGVAAQDYRTLREAVTDTVFAPFRRFKRLRSAVSEADMIWALQDVSFEIEPGEVVGIIGRNGAGKSTLLKILSRITEPTCGRMEIRGRVASLLEVGTGFHPELTGRENVYLNGAILGMTRREMTQKFDEIIAFAEVEKFVDTPVKRYSSGMYLRLAFAVAAHLEPEILLVDEVLAVGDAAFQKKCMGKMGSVAREGRTVLFVSHNLAAVRGLCPSCLYLDQGRIRAVGPTTDILKLYGKEGHESTAVCWTRPQPADGSHSAPPLRVMTVRLLDVEDTIVPVERPLRVAVDFIVEDQPSYVIPGIHFLNNEGTILFSSAGWAVDCLEPGLYTSVCDIPPFLLNEGRITVSAYLYNSSRPATNEVPIDWVTHTISFDVDASAWIGKTHNKWLRSWPGLVRPDCPWTTCMNS